MEGPLKQSGVAEQRAVAERVSGKSVASEAGKHQVEHGDVDARLGGGGEEGVVLAAAPLVAEPAEGPLDHPAPGQELEAAHVVGALADGAQPLVGELDPGDELPGVAALGPAEP